MRIVLKILKYVGFVLGVVVLLVGGVLAYASLKKPDVRPAPTEKVEATPARIARGGYLFNHLAGCAGCHSEHDETLGWPVKKGTEGAGACMGERFGFAEPSCSANLTSDPKAGLGAWSDGEIIRAIREGVSRDGRLLSSAMPYSTYRAMSDEDVKSVVAYLRTLPPNPTVRPPPPLHFPDSLMVKFSVAPVSAPVPTPAPTDVKAYGAYLANLGSCTSCHGEDLSGGAEFDSPWATAVSANLTPDPATGLKGDRAAFIARFRAFQGFHSDQAPQDIYMPWLAFSGLTDQDLGALYDYLKLQKPVTKAIPPIAIHAVGAGPGSTH